jgi:hypothetical protein
MCLFDVNADEIYSTKELDSKKHVMGVKESGHVHSIVTILIGQPSWVKRGQEPITFY